MVSHNPDSLGQHFLQDTKTLQAIADAVDMQLTDVVVEVGPGKGALTKYLQKGHLIAIEKDFAFASLLQQQYPQVQIIHGNAIQELDAIVCDKVVGNIAYSISEPLFRKLLKKRLQSIVLLTGKKFYDLLSTKDTRLGIIANTLYSMEHIADIPPQYFDPAPSVDSVAFKLLPKIEKSLPELVLQDALKQDDKKVKNCLVYSLVHIKSLTKKQAKEWVFSLGLPEDLLENYLWQLSNEEFAVLWEALQAA